MDYIISNIYDGKTRKLYKFNCLICSKEFLAPLHAKKKYCTHECGAIASRTRIKRSCDFCHEEFLIRPSNIDKSKSGLHFCSRICKDKAQRLENGFITIHPDHYGKGNGKWDYRERAFKAYGKVCIQCGYDKDERMIEVDHILGRKVSHKLEDLQVLCVWCHWMKTRNVPTHNWTGNIGGNNE